MHWLDIVILVVVGIATFLGFKFGLIKIALSLVGVIVGVILAGLYYTPLSEQLSFIPHDGAAKITAFAIILVGVMVVAAVLAKFLKWAASVVMLGWVNRLGGAVLGLVLGSLFCGALLATIGKYLDIGHIISESTLTLVLFDYFPAALALLPDEFDTVRSFFQ